MKKWLFIIVILVLLVGVIGFNFFVKEKTAEFIANMPEQSHPVTAVKLQYSQWAPTINAIGFIEPHQGVTISSESAGVITNIAFENGTDVSKGQLLIALDTSVEKANLKNAQVQLPAAKADYERLQRLFKQKSVSKQDLDSAEATYLALQANIDSLSATIARREIKAPFSGKVGIRDVHLGQYLQAGTDIVKLENTDVMKIRFTVPQTQLSQVAIGQQVNIHVDAYPDDSFSGSISAIEPAVFDQSGLVQIQASIPNAQGKLLSGMFARVEVVLPPLTQQIVLPQTAISFNLYGNSLYVIDKDSSNGKVVERVRQVTVKVLARNRNHALVSGDLHEGDLIVTSGLVSLSNHSLVHVVDDKIGDKSDMPRL